MSFLFISYVCFCYKIYALSACFICSVKSFRMCCLYVSVVMIRRFTCCLMFIVVLRYMPCLIVMFYILCFHAFNNNMLHMLIDHMFYIAMDMCDIMISMINNLLFVIIIMLIYGIKMIWKLPIYLTFQKSNYRHFLSQVLLLC